MEEDEDMVSEPDDAMLTMAINDNNAFLMAMGEDSRIEIHSASAAKESWVQLNGTVERGATELTLSADAGWQVGDRIAIASTSFYKDEAEEREIASISDDGLTITFEEPLSETHFGEIQTYDNDKSGEDHKEWTLDERAEVALLSRNVRIQGDEDSEEDGFGGHSMVMDDATIHISGAEFFRMGQEGKVGAYPVHLHLLGDVTGQYVEDSSVHHSYNKGITIHGTQSAWLQDNVIYNTTGHGVYFEDGAEFDNVLVGNLAFGQNAADTLANAAIASDHTNVSGYWIQNPDNHLIGNRSAGSDHTGFWITSLPEVQGASAALGLYDGYIPQNQPFGTFSNNTAHTSRESALRIGGHIDEETGVEDNRTPFHITQRDEDNNGIDYLIDNFAGFKSIGDAVWVRGYGGRFEDMILADNGRAAFLRGLQTVEDSLIVGQSDNDGGLGPQIRDPHGISLYDEALKVRDTHFAGFTGENSGAFSQHIGVENSTNHSVEGVTFDADTRRFTNQDRDGITDEHGTFSVGLLDLDGSISGRAGQVLTPRIDDIDGQFVTVERPGFNAAPGATYDDEIGAWVNPTGTKIGVIEHNQTDVLMTITRSDGPEISNVDPSDSKEFLVIADDEITYSIDHQGRVDEDFTVEVSDLAQGASVVLRYADLPQNSVFRGAEEVTSRDAFDAATGTTVFRSGESIFVKLVGTELDYDSNSAHPSVDGRLYSDSLRIITGEAARNANPIGDFEPEERDLERDVPYGTREAEAIATPSRPASTSETIEISDSNKRWSDDAVWPTSVPDADSIVVIGSEETLVLDTNADVQGIIVNGGELVVEDVMDIGLVTDYLLVLNGGLLQVGTEADPHEHDFTLTLDGDDPNADLDLTPYLDVTGIEVF